MSTAGYNELYYQAADILLKAKQKKGTIKTLVYASGFKNVRQMFALVSECIKNRTILENIASACPKAFHSDPAIHGDFEVATVLLYEYLLGRKFGRAVGFRKLFLKYKASIKSAVDKVLLQHGAKTLKEVCQQSNQETLPKIPRYMRVNQIKSSLDSAIKDLKTEGWEFVGRLTQDEFRARALSLSQGQFGLDPILPDLLVFPPGTDLHDHRMTRSGVLVQQDRASCVPAHVLSPNPGSTVLDTCAAPGNKTSHLASLLKDNGRVIALDRDIKRLGTMTRLLSNSGATCVELIHQDFLTVEPTSEDAEDIQFILVDPSCSGSGMLNTQTNSRNSNLDSDRIQTLKRFQISILKHALKFPNVRRVTYSTCSVHQQENEEVAEEVMSQVSDQFRFVKIFSSWQGSRGLKEFPHSDCFLRLSPDHDLTQGFFVACFERIGDEDTKAEVGEVVCDEISPGDQVVIFETNEKRKSEKKRKQGAADRQEKVPSEVTAERKSLPCEAYSTDVQTVAAKRKKKKGKHEDEEKVQGGSEIPIQSNNKKKKRKILTDLSTSKVPSMSDSTQKVRQKDKTSNESLALDSPNLEVNNGYKVKRKKKNKV